MKTPHRITLIRGRSQSNYNPETDGYETSGGEGVTVPCLINFIQQAKVFKDYGNQTDVVMVCRFQQEQMPFSAAIYKGNKYIPLDQINAPIKGAVRLKKAGG